MRKVMALAVWLAGSSVAFASGHERWKSVKELAPGKLIEVQREGQAGPDGCRVLSADDHALTCEVEEDPDADWDSLANARLVFPRSGVRNVWLLEPETHERRIWIGLGVGFALGAAFCARGGAGAAFACAGVGALIGLAVGANGPPQGPPARMGPVFYPGPGYPQRSQPPPELHRRLIYHAPAGP